MIYEKFSQCVREQIERNIMNDNPIYKVKRLNVDKLSYRLFLKGR